MSQVAIKGRKWALGHGDKRWLLLSPRLFYFVFWRVWGGIRAAGISRTALLLYYLLNLKHNAKFFPKLQTLVMADS